MSNWTRFIAGFDVHGDKQNKAACEVFFRFMKDWKPEIRVMGGDLFDFRKTKTDPFWMVTPVPKRGAESWIICGCFCDN